MLQELRDLTRLAGRPDLGVADLIEACGQVRSVLGAEDAYVMASGDPDFVRVGCPCAPNTYEIKQKGYWLIWREVVTNQQIAAGLFNVEERLVGPGAPLVAGRAATHLAAVLPGDESNSEIMVVRGPWAQGLTDAQIAFVEVARTIVSQIASAVLDAGRQARQRAQLEALASVATAFSEAREDERVLSAVATALAKASGFDWVMIAVYDDEQRRVVDRALNVARHSETETARLWRDNEGIRSVTNDGGGMTGLFGLELVKHGGPVFIPDVFDATQDEEPHMAAVRAIMPGLRKYYERAHILSVALFPIVFQGKVIGELSFSSSTRRAFDHAEADFLRALAAQTATTIKGMRLFRDLEHSREELRRSEERFRSLVQNASDLVTVIDADTTITYQSPSIERLLGYTPDQVVGTRLSHLLHNDDVARTLAVLHDAMTDAGAQAAAEVRVRHIDGSWRDVEFIGTNQFSNPAIAGFVLNIRDITERKLLEQQLRHQALHDPLTRLANRTRFSDRLEHALVRATRTGNAVAVLFMDLDNFKGVNDSLGHAAGDHLLTQVAERVQACIRPGDTVARLGGDEFAILLEEVATQDVAVAVTERIMEGLRASFRVEDKDLLVRASIGIAISGPGGAGDAESLLRDADVAMYVAKSQGKACYRIFEPSMQVSMMERLELIADLQRAIDRGEFMLQYQPMVLLQSGRLFGVEALVRWEHPQRGRIAPSEFIPLAEESGSIIPLGRWVLREACRQAQAWRQAFPAGGDWSISVNVSAKQLQDLSFVYDVEQALKETRLEPSRLILEITESVMMHDVPATMQRLAELKALGVRLAIDDFGTGYSSLSYLREFPFDLLKIDKSFIDDIGTTVTRKQLARAIIELGKTLDLELVAEGIEHSEQAVRLQDMDCELGQGFYFARPMDAAGVESLLRDISRDAA